MSTKDVVASIKQGDRVVYAIGGVEYNAVALGTAHVGYNPAQRLHSAFLSLVYLNEQGTPIKVFGAPILGSEVDDEHLIEAAADARKRDPRNAGASWDEQVALSDEHFERLKANPRTIGWRTGSADDDKRPEAKLEQPAPVESVTSSSAPDPQVLADDNAITLRMDSAMSAAGYKDEQISPAPQTLAPEPAEPSSPTPAEVAEAPVTPAAVPSAEDLDAVAGDGSLAPNVETKEYADGTSATGTAPLPDLSPAEQDLAEAAEKSHAELSSVQPETFVQTTPEVIDATAADSNVEIATDVPTEVNQAGVEVYAAGAPDEVVGQPVASWEGTTKTE